MKWLQTYVCLNEELNDTDDKLRYYRSRKPRTAIERDMLKGVEYELMDKFFKLLGERKKLNEVLAEVNRGHWVPMVLQGG